MLARLFLCVIVLAACTTKFENEKDEHTEGEDIVDSNDPDGPIDDGVPDGDNVEQLELIDQPDISDQPELESPPRCGDLHVDSGEDCDDGNDIDGDGCDHDCTYSCIAATQDVDCNDDQLCTDNLCDDTSHTCSHPPSTTTVLCRPAASGGCDIEEFCDGINPGCPEDAFQPPGTICDDGIDCTRDVCDDLDTCQGLNELHSVVAVDAGGGHTCALLSSGTVKCWGYNFAGQLGDGTITNRSSPVDVTGLSNVTAISAGAYHTCALLTSGGVKCWGHNDYGQLGDGTTGRKYSPVDVSGLTSGVAAIVAGDFHTCALTVFGGMKCWGLNVGRIGDGTGTNRTTPVDVTGLTSNVTGITASSAHTCALLSSGSAKCWGDNTYGQLGDGTVMSTNSPVDVAGLSNIASISAGSYHTCAVTSTGSAKCWGYNWNGQLGDGTTTESHSPVDVQGLSLGVSEIAGGGSYTCALLGSGTIKCWGRNDFGQLGDGTTIERHTPVDVVGLSDSVSSISAGDYSADEHACAALASERLVCWGHNEFWQLGDGTNIYRTIPVNVLGCATWPP